MSVSYTKRPLSRGAVFVSNGGVMEGKAWKKKNILFRIFAYFFPVKGDSVKEGIRKVIFTVAVACFIYFGSTVGFDLISELKAGKLQGFLDNLKNTEVDINDPKFDNIRNTKPLEEYLALYAENSDFVGWVTIGDSGIDYPVCQTTDNLYYLEHDFQGNYSKGGTIFADTRNRFKDGEISDNTVLYGHNILTGNYFSKLSRYYSVTDLSWYKQYPVVNFDTLYEKADWKVFACVLFNTQEEYGEVIEYYSKREFDGVEDFNEYILQIMDRSVLFTDVDLTYGDNILTLSTCYWPMGEKVDTRCVIFARKVRDGESSTVNTSVAVYNTQELRFTEQARRVGSNWTGRVWDTSKLLSYGETSE